MASFRSLRFVFFLQVLSFVFTGAAVITPIDDAAVGRCFGVNGESVCISPAELAAKPRKAMLQSTMNGAGSVAQKALDNLDSSLSMQVGIAQRQAPARGESQVMMFSNVGCNESMFAPTGSCPSDCPFFAEEEGHANVCRFRCVPKSQCGVLNPRDRIADEEGMFCRPCKVPGCSQCVDEPVDICAKCARGYIHAKDGHCYSAMWVVWVVIFAIVGLVGLVLGAWYTHLKRQPITNAEGLAEGLRYRSSLKLHLPKGQVPPGVELAESANGRHLWPMSTDLHDVQVAGPGLLLHFNFHAALIAWGCILVSCWITFAYMTEPELLLLGLYKADSPQTLCSVTLHGKKAQMGMMWAKVMFLVIAYLISFFGSLTYSVTQLRRYHHLDATSTTMRDFAVMCTGLPRASGTEKVEEQIAEALKDATGQNVVGVSVCWSFRAQAEAVKDAIEADAVAMEKAEAQKKPEETSEPLPIQPTKNGLFRGIDSIFGFGAALEEAQEETEEDSIGELINGLESSDSAFAVFESEFARDAAVAAIERFNGMTFQGETVKVEAVDNEPDTVCWELFTIDSNRIVSRCMAGVGTILLAVTVWCLTFYLPYAYYTASFSAGHNEEPGFLSGLTFSMLVVGGNQAMYFLCNEIAYRVGFRFGDDCEAFYIALYTFACFLNLVVDMMLEFSLGYAAMVAAGVHTADGRLLGDLTSYQDIFESYPMQKALGKRLYDYCFPSTFFLPFIFEPIFSIYVPYHIMQLLLRSNAGVRGREAEKSLDFFCPMDLARYGDLVLNVILASLIFFYPAGEMLKLFLALIISHSYVYVLDKYRVLRAVPGFCFAGNSADVCAQAILAIPCGFIAGCIVFKGNCLEVTPWCVDKGNNLAVACISAVLGHVTLHWLLLAYVVPKFKIPEKEQAEHPYSEVAPNIACNWFTANPLHCLRSKHVYKHSPPCSYFIRGREHLMKANPELGCYYEHNLKGGAIEEYEW